MSGSFATATFLFDRGDWRPETAKEKTAQIEIDLIAKFGSRTIESLDKFELQTHVNHLARTYCPDRLKQARSDLESIFDEAIEQEFLVKDPTRTLKIPKNLRPKDKQILTWEQMGAIVASASRRDRLILMLDMTDALRPSELFALRWQSFDDANTLSLTETVYRRYGLSERPQRVWARCIFRMALQPGSSFGNWSAQTPLRKRSCSRTRTADSLTPPTIGTEY